MSDRELKRLGVLTRVEKAALNLVNAAEILGLSYRQTKRIWRRYQEEGGAGLQQRSVGRESGRQKPKKFRLRGTATGTQEILRRSGRTIRADTGSRTFEQ